MLPNKYSRSYCSTVPIVQNVAKYNSLRSELGGGNTRDLSLFSSSLVKLVLMKTDI